MHGQADIKMKWYTILSYGVWSCVIVNVDDDDDDGDDADDDDKDVNEGQQKWTEV